MFDSGYGTSGFVLNTISLIFGLLGCTVSLVLGISIIHHQYHHRLKREEKITLLLSFQSYLFMFILMTMLVAMNTETFIGDLTGSILYSSWCELQGYFFLVAVYAMYHTFVVQAIYRLCRIVYSNYHQIQSYKIFIISGFILPLLGGVLVCPILVWQGIVYLPKEHYCCIVYTNVRCMVWMLVLCYLNPVVCLLMIYIRITLFLRGQVANVAITIKQRQQRDLLVIRRIFINFGILLSIGFPGMVIVFMSFATGTIIFLDKRITWLTMEIAFATLSIEMVLMTPQLKKLVTKRRQQNHAMTIEEAKEVKNIPPVP